MLKAFRSPPSCPLVVTCEHCIRKLVLSFNLGGGLVGERTETVARPPLEDTQGISDAP